MRHRQKKGMNLRLYITIYVFGVVCLAVAGASVFTMLLNFFIPASIQLPTALWILLSSIVLGGAITTFVGKKVLSPITRLSAAINQVAEGDFSVQLKDSSRISAVQDTYTSFNLMVRGLAATETLQSDFISNVSHEFKTPINAIEGYAMLLQDEGQSPEEQRECVEKILFNTHRLSDLVGNILLLSKVDNQAIAAAPTLYRLDEQIRQAILALEHKWTAQHVDFDVELAPVTYCGNQNLMLHVWTNLIDNGIKFSPPGGVITIRLSQEGSRISCSILDQGPGIPAQALEHIFERFYQADSSHKDQGNGLGLALVKRILDAAHGRVTAQNCPEGGALFQVTLPAAPQREKGGQQEGLA